MPDFLNPAAFLLVLFVPLLFIFRKIGIFSKISFPLTLADWNGKLFSWKSGAVGAASLLSRIFGIAGYAAAVIAFANPVVHHAERIYTSRGADIFFVLDTSPSMAAKDIAGMSRLDAARQAIHTITEQDRGASFGLVAMSTDAAVVVPPTSDHEIFLERLDKLIVGDLGNGSAIGTGLSTAVYHLVASTAPKKCIVLITDGENNAGSIHPETAAALAGENGIGLYLLGIGTRGTVPLEYVEPDTGKVYSGFLESGFDTGVLEQIAAAGKGKYFSVQNIADLSAALSSVSRHEKVNQSYHLKMTDVYYYDKFILAAAFLLLLAWVIRRMYLKEIV